MPYLRRIARELAQYREAQPFPPGHYYSPIPSRAEVRAHEQNIWSAWPRQLPSLELNEEGQVALLEELKQYYRDLPFGDKPKQGLRYHFENGYFSYSDAIVLYCMIRHLKPRKIIEIGSGYSSAVMLDTNDLFFSKAVSCTFIEPNPQRLLSLVKGADRDKCSIITAPLHDVGTDLFKGLSHSDILFVDSSHVAKVHSDVNLILFEILPILEEGVTIHFHDVFYPFEYPKEWVYQGKAFNEAYLLRAFLQYNKIFQIQFFNSFLTYFYRDRFLSEMPLCLKNTGASIWLRKLGMPVPFT
jgi:predicted O-methyltransferase YrrM